MSDLLESIKKNIMPFQNIIREKTSMFIDTFIDFENEDSYSEDFESDSEEDTKTIYENKIIEVPKQQTFNNVITKIIEKKVSSPRNYNQSINTIKTEHEKNNEVNNINKTKDNETNVESVVKEEIINNEENDNQKIDENVFDLNELIDDFLLMTNLNILVNLEENQKLYINYTSNNKLNLEILIDESYFPQISRWYYSQNRNNTINSIEKLINLTIHQMNCYKKFDNNEQYNKYKNLLIDSITGLNNLKITYNSDTESIFKINKIIDKINNQE